MIRGLRALRCSIMGLHSTVDRHYLLGEGRGRKVIVRIMFEDEREIFIFETIRVDGADEDLVEGYALDREPVRD